MSSPKQNLSADWQTQRSQRSHSSMLPVQHQAAYGQRWQPTANSQPYLQPYFADPSPVPVELPAPLPPAPPTSTPSQQIEQDERLARRISQLELDEDRRRRSSSALNPMDYPTSMLLAAPLPVQHPSTRTSSQSLHTHSQSTSASIEPWSPGSFGPAPNLLDVSSLPEVDTRPDPTSMYKIPSRPLFEDLPIPVLADQQATAPSSPAYGFSSLSAYLEQHRQVPYPPQWKPPPVVSTIYAYHGNKVQSHSTWLDTPDSCTWRSVRPAEHAQNPAHASYTFRFKTVGGSFRSPRFSWTMACPQDDLNTSTKPSKARKAAWNYELKLDSSSGLRKTEVLSRGSGRNILTTYVHARNYDSLRFAGPDGRLYMWVSSTRVSSVGGSRYDTVRHALFAEARNISDPLYGDIVADHAFWDGHVDEDELHLGIECAGCRTTPILGRRWKCRKCQDQDICDNCYILALGGQYEGSVTAACDFTLVNLPDETINFRSQTVDPALIVSTLQVLKDWEKHTLRIEKSRDVQGFRATEEAARKCDLGNMSYWAASDGGESSADRKVHGTRVKAKEIRLMFEESAKGSNHVQDAAFSLAGIATSKG
ncbi:hypothetical protein ACN47E_002326 [Coniothyrium glycines]